MEKPKIKNRRLHGRLLYKDDLRAYDQAFMQMEDNEFMGYTGIVLAQRDREKLRELIAKKNERDHRADLVNMLDNFTKMEE